MVLEQRIEDFLQYLRFEKRYSKHTILGYKTDLRQFSAYLADVYALTDPGLVTHLLIRSWLAGLKDEGQTATTINRKISSLNSFYQYLLRQGMVERNPLRQIHSLRVPERLPVYLTPSASCRMLEELSFDEGFKGSTDRLICELLYQTGMRRNELKTLQEDSVEWSLGQLRVLGKGNKERLIPVSPALLDSLRYYLQEKAKLENADRHHLLVLESGKPLYDGYIYRVVRKYIGKVATLKKKSPHVLRHTFATQLINNGANIQAIKDLLGHSSLAATQIYTHNHIDKLKEIHKLTHPRG